jgi:hypothetical protein
MRILLCDTLGKHGPLNGEILAVLEAGLTALGHETEKVVIPYNNDERCCAQQLLAMRFMPLSDRSDAAICLSSPALLMPHPRKVIWLCREPSTLSCGSDSRTWLSNALSVGYKEAIANFISTDQQKTAPGLQKIEAKLLEIPPDSDPQTIPWRKASEILLKRTKQGRAK